MKWFQHDSDASHDAKVRKLVMRHGAEGYAIYFHCLELIANNITQHNITFELEHDTEIIADNLKIKGTDSESGIDKVNRIMKTIIDLNLFTTENNRIYCFKLAQRLDNTVSRSPEINKIKQISTKTIKKTKLLRSKNVAATKKLGAEEIRSDKNRIDKNTYNNNVLLSLDEYNKLKDKYSVKQVESKIEDLSLYMLSTGKKYKSHYATILNWLKKDSPPHTAAPPKSPFIVSKDPG